MQAPRCPSVEHTDLEVAIYQTCQIASRNHFDIWPRGLTQSEIVPDAQMALYPPISLRLIYHSGPLFVPIFSSEAHKSLDYQMEKLLAETMIER